MNAYHQSWQKHCNELISILLLHTPRSALQGLDGLSQVHICGADAGDHERPAVAAQAGLQQRRQVVLPKLVVRTALAAGQLLDDLSHLSTFQYIQSL